MLYLNIVRPVECYLIGQLVLQRELLDNESVEERALAAIKSEDIYASFIFVDNGKVCDSDRLIQYWEDIIRDFGRLDLKWSEYRVCCYNLIFWNIYLVY
jgi:hypothetical protein